MNFVSTRTVGMASTLLITFALVAVFVTGSETFIRPSASPIPVLASCPRNCSCTQTIVWARVICDNRKREVQHFAKELNDYLHSRPGISYLTLRTVPLQEIPLSVCNLTKLARFSLWGSEVTQLDSQCFRQLGKLRLLTLRHNKIASLPSNLFTKSNFPLLAHLDLSENRLSKFPEELCYFGKPESALDQLNNLYMDNNTLGSVSDNCLCRLPQLTHLSLRSCQLKSFSINCTTDELPLLNEIDVSFNQLTELPGDCFRAFYTLELMHLNGNRLTRLPDRCFVDLYNLKLLNVSGNRLPAVSRNMTPHHTHQQYTSFLLDDNAISSVSSDFFSGYYGQKTFSLTNNNMTFIVIELNLYSWDVCSLINLAYNQITEVKIRVEDDIFRPGCALHLNLSHNDGLSLNVYDKRGTNQTFEVVDISYNNLTAVSDQLWLYLTSSRRVYLHNNQLTCLPNMAREMLPNASMSLYENPWTCSCGNVWLKHWLHRAWSKGKIEQSDRILCNTPERLRGRTILTVEDEDFCSDPADRQRDKLLLKSLLPTFSTLAVMLFVVAIVHRQRVRAFAVLNIHPFDKDECDGEGLEFDVFLSCAAADEHHARRIILLLEADNYKVCYHTWAFVGGSSTMDNMGRATYKSKRTLCLVSKNFIESQFCLHEFALALHRDLERKKKRLIVLKLEDITEVSSNQNSDLLNLNVHMKTHSYVDYHVDRWLEQLRYSLAVNKLGSTATAQIHHSCPHNCIGVTTAQSNGHSGSHDESTIISDNVQDNSAKVANNHTNVAAEADGEDYDETSPLLQAKCGCR